MTDHAVTRQIVRMDSSQPDYIDKTLTSTAQIWASLASLAACRNYREIGMLAGGRIVQSLKLGHPDAVRAAIGRFESSPLTPTLPVYSPGAEFSYRGWDFVKQKMESLPDYDTAAPTEFMAENCLPVFKERKNLEIAERRSAASTGRIAMKHSDHHLKRSVSVAGDLAGVKRGRY